LGACVCGIYYSVPIAEYHVDNCCSFVVKLEYACVVEKESICTILCSLQHCIDIATSLHYQFTGEKLVNLTQLISLALVSKNTHTDESNRNI